MASTDVFALHRDLSVSGTQKLDIRKILPEAFIGRNSRVETVIDVACVNNGLQDYLGLVNEHRSSQTCHRCYKPVRLARSRRLIDNKIQSKAVHGSVQCLNKSCPRSISPMPRSTSALLALRDSC